MGKVKSMFGDMIGDREFINPIPGFLDLSLDEQVRVIYDYTSTYEVQHDVLAQVCFFDFDSMTGDEQQSAIDTYDAVTDRTLELMGEGF